MSQNDTEQTSGVQSIIAVFSVRSEALRHCKHQKNKQRCKTPYLLYLRSDLNKRHAKRYPNVNRGMASRCYDVTQRPGGESWESEFNTETAHFLTVLFFT